MVVPKPLPKCSIAIAAVATVAAERGERRARAPVAGEAVGAALCAHARLARIAFRSVAALAVVEAQDGAAPRGEQKQGQDRREGGRGRRDRRVSQLTRVLCREIAASASGDIAANAHEK